MITKISKVIKQPRSVLSTVKYNLLSVFGDKDYKRFIVLTRSRSGSNWLISLINSHPHLKSDGEIFHDLNGRSYQHILAKTFSKQPSFIKAKGFKIFYYHPLDDDTSGVWDVLQSLDDLHVIHLRRENILKTLISRKIAGITKVWSSRSGAKPTDVPSEISFTEEELKKGFNKTREWQNMGNKWFRNHPVLSISYEDLLQDRSGTLNKVTKFLDISDIELKSPLKKQNKKSMREVISNYDDLKRKFDDTEWAIYFED